MRTLSITVDEETYARILRTIESKGWTEQDGPRHLLHLGLYTALAEEESSDDSSAGLRKKYADLGAAYATTHFKLFEALEANRILELNCNGFRASVESYKILVQKLREEVARLRAEKEYANDRKPGAN